MYFNLSVSTRVGHHVLVFESLLMLKLNSSENIYDQFLVIVYVGVVPNVNLHGIMIQTSTPLPQFFAFGAPKHILYF